MKEIVECNADDYQMLALIWERSVRATHAFLGEHDIAEIREALIPAYFPGVDLYAAKDENGALAAFVGLSGNKIEMLFVDARLRGMGYGSALVDFAKGQGIDMVDVNEQNQDALAFYLAKGFRVIGRDATDDCGRPFPILHLSLQ